MAFHLRQARRERGRQPFARRPRLFLDRTNPLEVLPENEIFNRYRFRPNTIYLILNLLNLQHKTLRNCALPPLMQLLVCLRFLATGAIHILIGDSLNISKSTAGCCIRNVSFQLSELCREFVKFPSGNGTGPVKQAFADIAGFPNVVGCIDCTHVRIKRPSENEADFVNRKGFHSLNVQMCCDSTYRITSVNASWPGSVHDSRIFRTSGLCASFENGELSGYLLGDSGYPCRRFLLTPLLATTSRAEERYNRSLCRTRVLIEQTFGVLKRRFQCLHYGIRSAPNQAVIYIVACVVLHNFGINQGDILNDDSNDFENNETVQILRDADNIDGCQVRQHVINTFFN